MFGAELSEIFHTVDEIMKTRELFERFEAFCGSFYYFNPRPTTKFENLSSCDELKRPIIDDALKVLLAHVVIPLSGWDRATIAHNGGDKPDQEIYWTIVDFS